MCRSLICLPVINQVIYASLILKKLHCLLAFVYVHHVLKVEGRSYVNCTAWIQNGVRLELTLQQFKKPRALETEGRIQLIVFVSS